MHGKWEYVFKKINLISSSIVSIISTCNKSFAYSSTLEPLFLGHSKNKTKVVFKKKDGPSSGGQLQYMKIYENRSISEEQKKKGLKRQSLIKMVSRHGGPSLGIQLYPKSIHSMLSPSLFCKITL